MRKIHKILVVLCAFSIFFSIFNLLFFMNFHKNQYDERAYFEENTKKLIENTEKNQKNSGIFENFSQNNDAELVQILENPKKYEKRLIFRNAYKRL